MLLFSCPAATHPPQQRQRRLRRLAAIALTAGLMFTGISTVVPWHPVSANDLVPRAGRLPAWRPALRKQHAAQVVELPMRDHDRALVARALGS